MIINIAVGHTQSVGMKFSNNVTSFPVIGLPSVFYSQFHPAVDAFYAKNFSEKGRRRWAFDGSAGFLNHRFFQNAIRINTAINFERDIISKLKFYCGSGFGYWHSFYRYEIFKLDEKTGNYSIISGWKGRPQFSIHLALGGIYALKENSPWSFIIEYRIWVHGIFANSYVPVVPYNSMAIGMQYKLKSKEL